MEINKQWQSAPIVSIYVPSPYQGQYCAGGYEAVLINITESFLPGGPCGCSAKLEAMCPGTSPSVTDTCASLDNMPYLQSSSWGSSTICIKRGGEAPVSESLTWWSFSGYRSRPIPNGSGNCPIGYKKCGEGFNQQEGATCCPVNEDCPITNVLVVPSGQKPPSDEGWESAGTFHSHNHTLYIRRQHRNELPVAQITFQLKEIKTEDASMRSICSVNILKPYNIATFPFSLWSTDPSVASACEPRSQRYVLVDQMPLQDHFLQNLQLTQPTCAGFSLYPLSDPRYIPALDPDYLNSGVKCSFDSKYICARDPYQRTDCTVGDIICDRVVNQNICGEYAHAVRSAFPAHSSVEMGMFFEREIRWTDRCAAHKESVFGVRTSYNYFLVVYVLGLSVWLTFNILSILEFMELRFLWDYLGFTIMVAILIVQLFILQDVSLYLMLTA